MRGRILGAVPCGGNPRTKTSHRFLGVSLLFHDLYPHHQPLIFVLLDGTKGLRSGAKKRIGNLCARFRRIRDEDRISIVLPKAADLRGKTREDLVTGTLGGAAKLPDEERKE
jgi:hypothetical protein